MTRRYAVWIPALLLLLVVGLSLRPRTPAAAGTARGDMGIVVTDMTPEARHAAGVQHGVLVLEVVPGGPADRKGIQEGDIITAYENEPVRSALELLGRIRRDGPGFQAGVSISREGSERWLGFVELAQQPVPPPSGDLIEARFERLEADIADLQARVDSLERLPRPIPRRPVVLH
jgi:hypothetical protein